MIMLETFATSQGDNSVTGCLLLLLLLFERQS